MISPIIQRELSQHPSTHAAIGPSFSPLVPRLHRPAHCACAAHPPSYVQYHKCLLRLAAFLKKTLCANGQFRSNPYQRCLIRFFLRRSISPIAQIADILYPTRRPRSHSDVDRLRSSGLASSSFQLDRIPASPKLHRGQGSARRGDGASLALLAWGRTVLGMRTGVARGRSSQSAMSG